MNITSIWMKNLGLRVVKYFYHSSLIFGAEYESQNIVPIVSKQNVFKQVTELLTSVLTFF